MFHVLKVHLREEMRREEFIVNATESYVEK
jgi:hypothetical protein